jgi:hypothetical protein
MNLQLSTDTLRTLPLDAWERLTPAKWLHTIRFYDTAYADYLTHLSAAIRAEFEALGPLLDTIAPVQSRLKSSDWMSFAVALSDWSSWQSKRTRLVRHVTAVAARHMSIAAYQMSQFYREDANQKAARGHEIARALRRADDWAEQVTTTPIVRSEEWVCGPSSYFLATAKAIGDTSFADFIAMQALDATCR